MAIMRRVRTPGVTREKGRVCPVMACPSNTHGVCDGNHERRRNCLKKITRRYHTKKPSHMTRNTKPKGAK